MAKLLKTLCILSLITFSASLAFAGDGPPSVDVGSLGSPLLTGWATWVLLGLVFLNWLFKKWAPEAHFFHTPAGTAAMTVVTLLLSAGTGAISQHGLNKQAIASAVATALFGYFAGNSPGLTKDGTAKALLPFFLAVSLLVPGCACSLPQNAMNPGCRVLDVVITCGVPQALPGFGALVTAVTPAITGSTIDWGALGNLEKQYGTNALMCALQQAENIAGGLGAAPAGAEALSANAGNVKKNVAEIFAKRHVVVSS